MDKNGWVLLLEAFLGLVLVEQVPVRERDMMVRQVPVLRQPDILVRLP